MQPREERIDLAPDHVLRRHVRRVERPAHAQRQLHQAGMTWAEVADRQRVVPEYGKDCPQFS